VAYPPKIYTGNKKMAIGTRQGRSSVRLVIPGLAEADVTTLVIESLILTGLFEIKAEARLSDLMDWKKEGTREVVKSRTGFGPIQMRG
jgi:hypothetical protein